jgi:hypothetical protein
MFKYSHVGVVTPKDTVIHATYPVVREDTFEEFTKRYPSYELREYEVSMPKTGYRWLHRQLNKPYDVSAIIGFLFQRDWAEEDAWFCSELAAEFLEKCLSPRFRSKDVKRVWPQTIYVVR